MRLWLAALVLSTIALAEEPVATFKRACYVFAEPFSDATKVCVKRTGAPVLSRKSMGSGWAQVEMSDCRGFTSDACLTGPVPVMPQLPPIVDESRARHDGVRVAVTGNFNGLLGRAGGDSSKGLGYGAQLRIQIPLGPRFRLSVAPSFQSLALSRAVDLSGNLTDPSESSFSNSVRFLGLGATLEYLVIHRASMDMELSLEAGGEFLYPIGATFSDSTGSSFDYKTNQKAVLGLLGASLDFALAPRFSLLASLHAYYNVIGGNGSTFFGARLGLAGAYTF